MYHPLITMEDVIDSMSENQPKIFSLLDLKSGYWQVPLDPETAHKSAFSTHQGHFEFTRMPFGLCNAPFAFQNLMHTVLRKMIFKYCLVYIDDVIVFSKNMDEHIQHLTEIFERFRQAKLKLHPSKCEFGLKKVLYLGHVLSDEGVQMDPNKITKMKDFPRPHSQKSLRQFLGLVGFYRRYIDGYSHITNPLNKLLKKDTKFEWDDDCEAAFQNLKNALTKAPILKYPNLEKQFTLATDASRQAISYILMQYDNNNKLCPVGYGGRSLSKQEKNYTVTEIEMLAVLEGIKHFHTFLANRRFIVQTDHCSLKYIKSLRLATGRLSRWALFLMGYNFDVVYKKGKDNQVADAFSRREYTPTTEEVPADESFEDYLLSMSEAAEERQVKEKPKKTWLVEFQHPEMNTETSQNISSLNDNEQTTFEADTLDIAPLQRSCEDFKDMMLYLEQGELPVDEQKAQKIVLTSEFYTLLNGKLYHLYQPTHPRIKILKPVVHQLCIPQAMRQEVVDGYHAENAHIGFERLYDTVRQKYYWPRLYTDLYEVVTGCRDCQQSKVSTKAKRAPLCPLPVASVFERVHIDLLGPLPESPEGFKYILVIVESFSRFPEIFALKTQKSEEIAEHLYSVFCRWGAPVSILSDLGKNLTSQVIKNLCSVFKIKHLKTSSYHPQSNAQCEVFNKTILQSFRLYCQQQKDWPKYINLLLYSYRATNAVKSTKISPFEILHGFPMRLSIDNVFLDKHSQGENTDSYMNTLAKRIQLTEKIVKENVKDSPEVNRRNYDDAQTEIPTYEIGDKVWLRNMKRKVGENPKMVRPWTGPWIIVQKGTKNWHKLRNALTDAPLANSVHANRLKRFVDPSDTFQNTVENAKKKIIEDQRKRTKVQRDNGVDGRKSTSPDTKSGSSNTDEDDQRTTNQRSSPPLQCDEGEDGWYSIKEVLQHQGPSNKRMFLVRWNDDSET